MKKFLLSIAAVAAFGLAANAGEVVFNFTAENAAETYGLPPYDAESKSAEYVPLGTTITSGEVSISLNGEASQYGAWRMWSDGLRAYSGRHPYFTVSTTNGEKVTYVTWKVLPDATFALEGTEDNITAWVGSADEVTFIYTADSNKAVESITVGYGDYVGEVPVIPDAPTGVITVADAIKYINAGGTDEITVKGVVTEVESYNSSYGSLTYWIADEGTENKMEVYGGLSLNGDKFASENAIAIGAVVEVKGKVQDYKGTPEFSLNSVLVSYLGPNGETAPSEEGGDNGEIPSEVMTVAEALAFIMEGNTGEAVVKGIISEIAEVSVNYGNATYTLVDKLGDENGLIVYRGYGLNGDKFTSENQIVVGATVIVSGTLVNYNDVTPEFTSGSKILDYTAPGDDTGIEGIEADLNAPAVYYNLQGVRVNDPVKGGLYIIRQGKTAKKAILR